MDEPLRCMKEMQNHILSLLSTVDNTKMIAGIIELPKTVHEVRKEIYNMIETLDLDSIKNKVSHLN